MQIPRPSEVWRRTARWVLHRAGLEEFLAELRATDVPRHLQSPLYYLGALALACFVLLFLSGILIALHYVPSAEAAWDSVQYLTYQVPFGGFLRRLHQWASSLVIITMVLHMARVYFTGAFKKPREVTWLVGVVLFLLVLAAAFTGSILPWSQRAYWSATVGLGVIAFLGTVPGIGPLLQPVADFTRDMVVGGPEVGPWTLTRFYAVHVILIPLLLTLLIGFHLFLVNKHDRRTLTPMLRRSKTEPRKPLWPSHILEITALVLAFMGVVVIAAAAVDPTRAFEPGIGDADARLLAQPVDPYSTPRVIQPDWYFVGLDELLKRVPPWTAMALATLVVVGLVLLPFLDRKEERHPRKRLPFTLAGVVVLLAWISLTLMGVL